MQTKVFTVNGKRVDVAMASAVRQDELLGLLAQRLIVGSSIARSKDAVLNENSVLIMMMTLPVETKEKVSALLTEKAIDTESKTPVSVKDFGGRMVEWNRFLAQLVMWNLGDFFDLLASVDLEEALKAKA